MIAVMSMLIVSVIVAIITIIIIFIRIMLFASDNKAKRSEKLREPPPYKRKRDEQSSNLTIYDSKLDSGSNISIPPLVSKLTDLQAQDADIRESDEAFRERIRKEIKKVFDGFRKEEYEEIITKYQAEKERFEENLAREEKELNDRRIDEEKKKQQEEFSKQREAELKAMSDKDKAERKNDFNESTKFVKNAFAGNTIIDDTLWMSASMINNARMTVLDIYKFWKMKQDMKNVNEEFLKKTEDIEKKAEANKKSLAELKSEYKGYDEMAKRLDMMQKNTKLYTPEERRNLNEQLKVALGNRNFIKERIIERGCTGANALDKHLQEIDEQLEKCKRLRDGADRDRTELSKDIHSLKNESINAYLNYQESVSKGMELYQREKDNMTLAKDLTEQYKEIDTSIRELKTLHDDIKTTSIEKAEIEHEINYLKEKQENILAQFERRSGMERGEMSDADYVQAVEKRYLSYEARQDMADYSKQFESHFSEYDSVMRKYLEDMNGKDFAKMVEQGRSLSDEKILEMQSKIDSLSALRYSIDAEREKQLQQIRNDYQQTEKRIADFKIEMENPAIEAARKEALERTLRVAQQHKNSLQEDLTRLDGDKQPNFVYKDYERTVRNSYESEINILDKAVNKLKEEIYEAQSQRQSSQEQQHENEHDNDNNSR